MLTLFEYDILYLRIHGASGAYDAQALAAKLGTSTNALARAVRSLQGGGYLDKNQSPTLAGREIIQDKRVYSARYSAYQSKYLEAAGTY